jgi:hypothetical protein
MSLHHSQDFAYPKRQPSTSTRSRATALPKDGPKQKVEVGEVSFMLLIHHLRHSI